MVGGEAQQARVGVAERGFGLDAGARQHRRGFLQDATLGQRQDQLLVLSPRHFHRSANANARRRFYATGWAGFHGVGQGSPTSPKWHARRPISSRMERSAAKCRVTEPSFPRPDRQQVEHPVGLVERDLVMVDGLHLVENKGGMGPPVLHLDGGVAFPAEAVEQEDEALLVGEPGAVADRHQRVLDGGRDHAEVVGVERRKVQLVFHSAGFRRGVVTAR